MSLPFQTSSQCTSKWPPIRLYSKSEEIRCSTAVPSKIPIRKLSKALFLHYKAEKSTFSLPLRYEFLYIKNKNASSLQSWKILH